MPVSGGDALPDDREPDAGGTQRMLVAISMELAGSPNVSCGRGRLVIRLLRSLGSQRERDTARLL
jgi:hypothetical protein